jgi:hypothetical protein
MSATIRLCLAIGSALGLLVCAGCASSEVKHTAPAPPPPSAEVKPQRTFDYPHTLRNARQQTLRRKLVVALVRFAEDKALGDVPFGPEPNPEPATEAPEVQVNVNVDSPTAAPPPSRPPRRDTFNTRAREILKRELIESDAFVVVERDSILDILREIHFGQTKYVNPETSPEVGEIMSVQYLIEGSMGLNEDRSFKETIEPPPDYKDGGPSLFERILNPGRADVRERMRELNAARLRQAKQRQMQAHYPYGAYLSLYNVRTSQVEAEAFGIGANGLDAIRDAIEDLVDKCLDIPQPPRIAWVDGERVFIDLGQDDGVEVGRQYRYVSEGKVIRNTAGQVIGRDEQEGGILEITRVDALMSVGKITRRVTEPAVGDRIETAE